MCGWLDELSIFRLFEVYNIRCVVQYQRYGREYKKLPAGRMIVRDFCKLMLKDNSVKDSLATRDICADIRCGRLKNSMG